MKKVINWFRIRLDRHTHDAKFEISTGTGQEINLQIQANLYKTETKLDEALNKIDEYESIIAESNKEVGRLKRKIQVQEEIQMSSKVDLEKEVERLTEIHNKLKINTTRDLLIEKDNNRELKNEVERLNKLHSENVSQYKVLQSYVKQTHPEAKYVCIKIQYDEFTGLGDTSLVSRNVTTVIPLGEKNEYGYRLDSALTSAFST